MGSFNQNILPATQGLNLGSQSQPWNIFANAITASSTGLVTQLGTVSGSVTISPSGIINLITLTLSGNVTVSTFNGASLPQGALVAFKISQNSSGGFTFAWPSSAINATIVGSTANQITYQLFVWDGANLCAFGPGVLNP